MLVLVLFVMAMMVTSTEIFMPLLLKVVDPRENHESANNHLSATPHLIHTVYMWFVAA